MALFIPETVLIILAFLLFCLSLLKDDKFRLVLKPFMLLSGVLLLVASAYSIPFSGELFYSTYKVDLLSQGFKTILAGAFLFTVLFSENIFSAGLEKKFEYYLFLFTATLGMMMIASSVDILALYLSLELSSYSLYLLSALRRDRRSAESSVKYLLFGAAASGFLLWGFSLMAGLAGTTSLTLISQNGSALLSQPAFILGLAMVTFSFLFKLSGFPAHFWAPDVYESAPTPITTFIATASKAAAVAVLIRFFMLTTITHSIVFILGVLAFISMTLGNAVAIVQRDVKRLLAYSSIAQAGYILVGLLAGTAEGYSSMYFYAFAYTIMNAGAFLVTLLIAKSLNHDNPQIEHFDGLAERSPLLALILLLSLLSLAGIPPLVGFTGKWILFTAAMQKGHWFLVLWGVLNSVVSLFYYLTLVKHAYLEKPATPARLTLSIPVKILCVALFCALVFLGIFPNTFITFAQQAIVAATPGI
jgi:NADH-quinone oxidoreductase subunit N